MIQSFRASSLSARKRWDETGAMPLIKRVFRSKIDAWLLVAFAGSAVMAIFAAGLTIQASATGMWVSIPVVLVGVVFPFWLLVGTTYTLEEQVLLVRCGPFKWTVHASEIRSVTPTRSPMSSPALSMDRLRIDYGTEQHVMISPVDKAGFMEHLEKCRSNPL